MISLDKQGKIIWSVVSNIMTRIHLKYRTPWNPPSNTPEHMSLTYILHEHCLENKTTAALFSFTGQSRGHINFNIEVKMSQTISSSKKKRLCEIIGRKCKTDSHWIPAELNLLYWGQWTDIFQAIQISSFYICEYICWWL